MSQNKRHKFDAAGLDLVEEQRLLLQQNLDAEKTQEERNRLGQFATPTELSIEILNYAKNLLPGSEKIRFLDPAFGTGSFYSALLRSFPPSQIECAFGYEIDTHYGISASKFWDDGILNLNLADFTKSSSPVLDREKFDLIICNPPYVRHHHLNTGDKTRLRRLVTSKTNCRLNGLAGLYCYFLLLSQSWMSPGGLAGWLIPSEFLEVKYGHEVKQFLLKNVTLLHIHRFDPRQTQFEDALVSSVVIWFRNSQPKPTHQTKFSFGGTLTNPEKSVARPIATLDSNTKWTWAYVKDSQSKAHKKRETELRLSDLFVIKRGIATGANKFFILTAKQVFDLKFPQECIKPILPSPRYLELDEIESDQCGHPKIEKQLFLLDCNLPESAIKEKYPSVWNYLQTGIEQGIHKRYLCRHRSPWYSQESRPAASILCTYMGRFSQTHDSPFRFILNHSEATAPNVYLLLYPKPTLAIRLKNDVQLLRSIWQVLRQIAPNDLIAEGRVYGGGLHKIEPNELAKARIRKRDVFELSESTDGVQLSLF
jgi:hypothetical protein